MLKKNTPKEMILLLSKRMKTCLITGALLGVVCIIGAQLRSGFTRDTLYLFSFWYNRLLMGFTIGLAAGGLPTKRILLRGAMLGALVSFAFYSSTGLSDTTGFLAGIVYGILIELAAKKWSEKPL